MRTRMVTRATRLAPAALFVLLLGSIGTSPPGARASRIVLRSPIRHVVLIDEENHSFDNVLGRVCADVANGTIDRPGRGMGCDGATRGTLPDGGAIPLARAADLVPLVNHDVVAQHVAVNAGRMDGFGRIPGCGPNGSAPHACYSQYGPDQIPNITTLAGTFVVSDRTFEFRS